MGNKKIMMLVFSVLLGAVAGFALLGYVRGVEDDVLDDVARVDVWVVTGPIAEGTTAASARQTNRLELSQIESSFRPANAVTELSEIEGQIAASDLVANQILLAGSFADPSAVATTYADQIAPDYTALSITIDKERAVNGFLSPGDFVDVIVLGDPVIQAGEADVFETSLAASPYDQPARSLFRGVRIESIDDLLLNGPPPAEGEVAPPDEEASTKMTITFSVPSSAAQRLLSVSPEDIVLTLLPADWVPEQQENEVIEAIIIGEDLPGEDPLQITPYGAEGFVDLLAENAGNDAADDAATSQPVTPATTDDVDEDKTDEETDEAADDEEGQ